MRPAPDDGAVVPASSAALGAHQRVRILIAEDDLILRVNFGSFAPSVISVSTPVNVGITFHINIKRIQNAALKTTSG